MLPSKIPDYVSLENLFFNILAKKIQDRGSNQFEYIPYLNSSLFEVHADELKGITIATLAGDAQMDYYNKTVVKDNLSHKKTGKVNTLAYLFDFLDAYDFANDSKDEITTDNKSLISASVLGLIFEKINGYKDGSFYTPSFVTMYMAKETIEKTILQKFNLAKSWECKSLIELDNKLDVADIVESNSIINDIKICDPAVGSGHFLVSALNEILKIKSQLGILMDESGKRIKDYAVTIENDELILKDFEDGTFFEYKKGHFEKTRIQKTLFKEKQKIIENCLFGVDMNPNSVNICRLRLWVELLKNAYYKPDGTLDTLPNIDINIKCGNSLISRFGIKDDLKSRSIQAEIKDYKDKVIQYKQNIGSKRDVAQAIEALKTKFSETLKAGHGSSRGLQDVLGKYVTTYGFDDLSKDLIVKAVGWNFFGKQAALIENAVNVKDKAALVKQVLTLEEQVQEIESGAIYKNAFEWRFEFPEVLNDKGDYIGFDLIIENPPYIQIKDIEWNQRRYFENKFNFSTGRFNIFYLFIEISATLVKQDSLCAHIVPDRLLLNTQCSDLRKWLIEKQNLQHLISFGNTVFDNAIVDCIICIHQNSLKNSLPVHVKNLIALENLMGSTSELIPKSYFESCDGYQFDLNYDVNIMQLINKIKSKSLNLSDIAIVKDGIIQGAVADELFIKSEINNNCRKLLFGENINKYKIDYQGNYVNYNPTNMMALERERRGENVRAGLWLRNPSIFERDKILTRQTADQIIAAFDDNNYYYANTLHGTTIENKDYSPYYVLAILNRKVITWYYRKTTAEQGKVFAQIKIEKLKTLPIKIASIIEQENIINLVKNLDSSIATSIETIDNLIYKLYDLTLAEIKAIDPESTLTAAQYEALG